MKNSYKGNRDYYPDTSRVFNASTRSLAERRHNMSSSKVSESKSKFQNRIQKACPTNSIEAYKKQAGLLKRQLQRLQKQNLKKDNRIFQMETNHTMFRQIQSELQETYRIIYMYEGKIQELQKQLKRLQHKIADNLQSAFTAEQIQSLLNEYRDDNTEMRSTIEGQNRVIMELQQRLRTIQSKYFQTSWKLSSQNRIITNPLKKKFPKLRDTIVIQQMTLSQRQKMMNQLENKYQTINMNTQKEKENLKVKDSRFSKQKITLNNNSSQPQSFKDSRFTGVWQTPRSAKISKTIGAKHESVSDNYTMQKVQSSPKVYGNDYRQEWQASKEGTKPNYQFYRGNQTKRNQLSSQGQPFSLNYSSSQGPNTSQRSTSPQNGVTTYRISSSQAGQSGGYVYSQNNNSSSQVGNMVTQNTSASQSRPISNSKLFSNDGVVVQNYNISNRTIQTNKRYSSAQSGQSPLSPSSRVIRVSRDKIEPSYAQNKQTVTYYQGTNSFSSGSGDTNKQIRYVMRPAS